MIHIMDGISIPEDEVTCTASRSGGPGGQNVNKVSTKITLSFPVSHSAALSDEQKSRIAGRLASRINNDGVLQVVSQRTRSQEMNRTDAIERFSELLRQALTPRKARIKTRQPKGAKEQRLEEKKHRSAKKQTRSTKGWD
ncbi:MAG TPA: alternative ribosome rescue aminoacyl-tRNA hydrolase ArfB [Terriglobia bacterium]|jgi:ribosome-associated protein